MDSVSEAFPALSDIISVPSSRIYFFQQIPHHQAGSFDKQDSWFLPQITNLCFPLWVSAKRGHWNHKSSLDPCQQKAWMKHLLKSLVEWGTFLSWVLRVTASPLGHIKGWVILVSCAVKSPPPQHWVPIHNSLFIHSRAFPWPDVYPSCVTLQLFCRGGRSGFWKTFEYTYKYRLGLLCVWTNK